MPVYARFIKDADIYHEEHVYVKAIVIFNYNHGHDLKNLLNFGIELAKQFHQREFLYKAPHQQLQAIDQNGNLIDKSCLEDIISGRLITSYFAKLYNHMLGGEPPEFISQNYGFRKILSSFAGCYANPAPLGISERQCRIAHKEIFIK